MIARVTAAARIAALLCGLAAAPAFAQAPAYQLSARELAPGVYVVEGALEHFTRANGGAILNPGILIGPSGVTVIQTGPSKLYGESLRQLVARLTDKPILQVYVSNLHPDYFLGNQAFADIPIAALPGTIEGITAEAKGLADNMYRMLGDWMKGTEPLVPSQAAAPGPVAIGGRSLRLIALSGHTAADLAVFDEASGVLFAGGVVFCDRAPTTPHADLSQWLKALDAVDALPGVTQLVPNHGHIRADKTCVDQTRGWLTWLQGAIRAAMDSGQDMAEALVSLTPPDAYKHMAVREEELKRSIAHLWPKLEQAALPRAN